MEQNKKAQSEIPEFHRNRWKNPQQKEKPLVRRYLYVLILAYPVIYTLISFTDELFGHENLAVKVTELYTGGIWIAGTITLLINRKYVWFWILALLLPLFLLIDALYIPDYSYNIYTLTAMFVCLMLVFVLDHYLPYGRFYGLLSYAGKRVNEAADGYSERPYPAGEFEFTKNEALGFAKIWLKYYDVHAVESEENVTIYFGTGLHTFFPSVRPDPRTYTHAILHFDGTISVFIAARDYRRYRKELTFDRLCAEFAGVMMEFLDLYRAGQTFRIDGRLNNERQWIFN